MSYSRSVALVPKVCVVEDVWNSCLQSVVESGHSSRGRGGKQTTKPKKNTEMHFQGMTEEMING